MISFIGVQPALQDQGIGHILLAAINEVIDADEQSNGVAVFATLDKCLSFFDDGGFKFIEKVATQHIHGQILYKSKK
jgi:N-acetylglutamate synthase-like GNAT family acetyltransferase